MRFSSLNILKYFLQKKKHKETSKELYNTAPLGPLIDDHSTSRPRPTSQTPVPTNSLSPRFDSSNLTGPFIETTDSTPIPEVETPFESEVESLSVPCEITTLERPRLWALIIGINDYINIRPLRGAASDADAVSQFLQDKLNVPASQINNLRNGAATRSGIIAGFKALTNNGAITFGDPILIYFAGHGGELPPTEEHPATTQALIPVDFIPTKGSELGSSFANSPGGRERHMAGPSQSRGAKPIPDRTVASLINGIAKRHGDNITVILDCCHSGSGTRGEEDGTRGILLGARDFSPGLDSRIIHAESNEPVDGTRSLHHAKGFTQKGMGSHVLLAACSAGERAREDRHGPETRGRFTAALLQLFESVSPDQITYADVLTRMPLIEGQNPQCEGLNKHRGFFNSKVIPPIRKSYAVKVVDGLTKTSRKRIVLDAGKAHGITDGAEFTLYKTRKDIPDSLLGIMVAKEGPGKIEAFTTILQCTGGSDVATMVAGDPTVAVQTKAGVLEDLKIYVPPEEINYPVFQAIAEELDGSGSNPCRIILEPDRGKAQLEIVAKGENEFTFNILDEWTKEYQVGRMPHTAYGKIDDTQDLQRILRGAAHYHHHLNVTQPNNQVSGHIMIEFFQLEEVNNPANEDDDPALRPVGPNLLKESGKIECTIDDNEEAQYGIKITNNGSLDLYFVCLYFDHSDFSIVALTETDPQTVYQKDYMLNRRGGVAEIGYGSLGLPPLENDIPEGQDVCLGFLKIYFTSQVVDLSKVPQKSPFEGVRGFRMASRSRNKPSWGTVVIPIVQRRAQ